MIAAARDAGVKLGAIFQRRFFPAAQRMKAAIDAGRLGRVTSAQCIAHLSRDRAYFDSADWRGTWEFEGGGALMNQAIHMVDMLQWLVGTPVEVYGRAATLKHGDYIDVEDTAVATVEFDNGALAFLHAVTTLDPQLGFRVAVHGTSGHTVGLRELPELTQAVTDVWTFEGEEDQRAAWEREESGHPGFPAFHRLQLQDFARAVLDDREPAVTGAEARTSLEMIQAVYISQRTRQPVALPMSAAAVEAAA
jgi:predicted dehydrogenase